MVVKNEEKIIRESVSQALVFASEVVVIDTGSEDDTKNILKMDFEINPIDFHPPKSDRFSIVEARNFGLKNANHDWVMILDADEIVETSSALYLKQLPNEQVEEGFFGNWINSDREEYFWDYKLFIFKRSLPLEFLGRCHAVPQSWLRKENKRAALLTDLTVFHDKDLTKKHRSEYIKQMENAIKETPEWYRYHWFMGYSLLNIEVNRAKEYLLQAADSNSKHFPVEVLNARLCLVELALIEGDLATAHAFIGIARAFFEAVKDDFEVKINPYDEWLKRLQFELILGNGHATEYKITKFAF
jgi:glycosyltransferase involved in cell wall biosynthesis